MYTSQILILKRMILTTNSYDRTICRAVYKPNVETVYILRQFYDYTVYCSNEYISEDI